MNSTTSIAQTILDQCIYDYTRPLCVTLDNSFTVKSFIGDCAYYGFDCIEIGTDARESMLFLVGMDVQKTTQLRFVETPSGRSAHINLFIESEQLTLVLLDATEQRVNHAVVQQKGNELALMQVKQLKLIEELKRLEKEVEAKRRQAEKANRLKGQFIATMSHEFRTPLTAIIGYASRLKPMHAGHSPQTDYLNSVERSAKHLLSLVENLLDHSQIEVGSLTINPIATDVAIVIEKLSSIFEPLAEDKHLGFNIELKSGIPQYLCLDEMRFRQVLVNLISNAIKFTNKGYVQVDTSWEAGELIVSIEDTGKGIAESDQKRIFNAFEQLGSEPGTGLGLSIVKHLVSAMGGRLEMRSTFGVGTRFEVCFPAQKVDYGSDLCGSKHKNEQRYNKRFLKTVLLVEDDPDIMHLLEGIFDQSSYRCLLAGNGNDALKIALSEWPDLVMLDLNLPDMTGFDVIKSLRNSQFVNPVFVQSAWVSTEYKAKAIAAGCDEYLLKPLDSNHLKKLISDYFFNTDDPGMPVERYQALYQRFLNSFPEKQKTLQQFLSNDIETCHSRRQDLHTYVHRLAGSAEMYGMKPIASTAKLIDQLLSDYASNDVPKCESERRKQIINALSKLSAQIDQVISEQYIKV